MPDDERRTCARCGAPLEGDRCPACFENWVRRAARSNCVLAVLLLWLAVACTALALLWWRGPL